MLTYSIGRYNPKPSSTKRYRPRERKFQQLRFVRNKQRSDRTSSTRIYLQLHLPTRTSRYPSCISTYQPPRKRSRPLRRQRRSHVDGGNRLLGHKTRRRRRLQKCHGDNEQHGNIHKTDIPRPSRFEFQIRTP